MNVLELIEHAIKGREKSYSPYSRFKVGASILLKNGTYVSGCNIENISYGLSNCAERTTLFKVISDGYTKDDIVAMAVVADTKDPVSPCGACRQVMAEFLNPDTPIFLANLAKKYKQTNVKELLPYGFEEIENAN
ncbi:MAG: cytidine deaminase [Anaeroplasmataceae bacterium]|nr:cytidine deaminase [Anaeroplasmataceae bacterium]